MHNPSILKAIKKGVKRVLEPKIKVERIHGNGDVSPLKKYPIRDGKVIIKTGGLGRGDIKYEPPLEADRIAKRGRLFKTKLVYYQDGADRLMPLTPDGTAPKYTVDHYVKTAKAKILEKQAKVGASMTPIQWVTMFFSLASLVLLFLVATNLGVIKLG